MCRSVGYSRSSTTALSPGRQSMPFSAMFEPHPVHRVKAISSGLAPMNVATFWRTRSARFIHTPRIDELLGNESNRNLSSRCLSWAALT